MRRERIVVQSDLSNLLYKQMFELRQAELAATNHVMTTWVFQAQTFTRSGLRWPLHLACICTQEILMYVTSIRLYYVPSHWSHRSPSTR